ncbi:MAG TPA: maleylpyruvate isomerase family mycothiol-dependent enzyme [Acidimicrobiia bacterium]|nr:maleylpyruvate isomerase family mycothiol-dependent enzyme [Acidimicrobiia bacterium]
MSTTITDVAKKAPFTHAEAMELQAAELERTLDFLRSLDAADWTTQTVCPDWDVHRMYLHVLGACEAAASMKENLHQMLAAKRLQKSHGGPLEAGLSAVQVRERLDLSPAELVERFAAVAPVTVRKRTRMPALMRRMPMKIDGPVVETWKLGYLVDTIYLRDLWMHRVDAARATGRDLALSAGHDGRIVADVVAEWARRHGRPFTLTLTGIAGGTYTAPDTGTATPVTLELDAVEFCQILAGRGEATGLLETIVPF